MAKPGVRSRRTKRLLMAACLAGLALIIILADAGVSQKNDPDHPGNKVMGENGKGSGSYDCVVHHRAEMRDAFILVPLLPRQLKLGEEALGHVQVINPWKHHVAGMSLNVSMTARSEDGRTLVIVPGASGAGVSGPQDAQLNFEATFTYKVPPLGGGTADELRIPFTTKPGAEIIAAQVFLQFADTMPTGRGGVEVKLRAANEIGKELLPTDGRAPTKSIVRNDSVVRNNQNWELTFRWDINPHTHGDQVNIRARVNVIYSGAGGHKQTYNVPLPNAESVIDPGRSELLTIPLLGLQEGVQEVEIAVRGMTYYRKGHGDGTPDYDNYTRYWRVPVQVGASFIPAEGSLVDDRVPGSDVRLVIAEVSGFSAALLLGPSLLMGGAFGKSSRRIVNAVFGGAKRRVMYHSMLSLGITVTALVHVALFFLETLYSLKMGMVYGGLGTLSLLILGLTGYYQVPFIQRRGYRAWRYTHLTVGVLVLVFVAVHALVDGPDFKELEATLPGWLDLSRLNLSNK
jgi:hypothetical protein